MKLLLVGIRCKFLSKKPKSSWICWNNVWDLDNVIASWPSARALYLNTLGQLFRVMKCEWGWSQVTLTLYNLGVMVEGLSLQQPWLAFISLTGAVYIIHGILNLMIGERGCPSGLVHLHGVFIVNGCVSDWSRCTRKSIRTRSNYNIIIQYIQWLLLLMLGLAVLWSCITSVWILLVSTSLLVLISKVMDQFGLNFVYVSYIQGGNLYVSLRKSP